MRKHTKIRQCITVDRTYPCICRLCMTNVISDIPFFFGKHKTIGIVLICIGVVCFIAANHLKKGEKI